MSPHDINAIQPTSLSHLVGQESVKQQVAVALDAAFADHRTFDSALLVGPPGVGKSALAQVIACELSTDLHEVLGQSIRSPADLNGLLLNIKDKDVLHIDEAHELRKEFQTALYLAIDKRVLFAQSGGRAPVCLQLADFTLMLSTTDEYGLLQPLRDRLRLLLRFEFYSQEELLQLLSIRSRSLAWEIDSGVLPAIASRSQGTPRLGLRLLQACHRVSRADGKSQITPEHLERACLLASIDTLGLSRNEQQYLIHLAQGATRLNLLASRLGTPPRTVSQVIEPYLLRAGLVTKDDAGRRILTEAGRQHLESLDLVSKAGV